MNESYDTVFITGASRGLGLALSELFLEQGHRVFAGYLSSATGLSDLQERYGERLCAVKIDVSDPASVRAAVTEVKRHTDTLDLLVNNAGVHLEGERVPFEQLDFGDGHLEATMAVNSFGLLRVTQTFLELLEVGAYKRIVNITSEAGSIGACTRDREFAYCMSKSAANMATKLLHNNLSPRGFTVLAVHPGWIQTDMGGPAADLTPAEAAADVVSVITGDAADYESIYFDHTGAAWPW